MKLFSRKTRPARPGPGAAVELLVFECPEIRASETMRTTIVDCCRQLGLPYRTIDVWLDPDAVCRHRLLLAPTAIVLADGVEIGRLSGPRSCRQIERFVAEVIGVDRTASERPIAVAA